MRRMRGFTLIELLVVIAIIAILATLVITQLQNARVKANNTGGKNDVQAAGKAIEAFKVNDSNASGGIIEAVGGTASAPTKLTWTLSYNSTTNSYVGTDKWSSVFTGVENVSTPTYGAGITKTAANSLTYNYCTNVHDALANDGKVATPPTPGYNFWVSGLTTGSVDTSTPQQYFNTSDGSTTFSSTAPSCS